MHIRAEVIENIPENTRRKRAGVQPQERARPDLVKLSPGLVTLSERESGRRVWGDDDLGALKVLDLRVSHRGHRPLEGTHEVQ